MLGITDWIAIVLLSIVVMIFILVMFSGYYNYKIEMLKNKNKSSEDNESDNFEGRLPKNVKPPKNLKNGKH